MDTKYTHILEKNDWTIQQELCKDVPEMGLPCDSLGAYVHVVRDKNGYVIGCSQLMPENAIDQAIGKRSTLLVDIVYPAERAVSVTMLPNRAFDMVQQMISQLSDSEPIITISFMADVSESVE
jgi:hypothetical protein